MAQLVERMAVNHKVRGSNPRGGVLIFARRCALLNAPWATKLVSPLKRYDSLAPRYSDHSDWAPKAKAWRRGGEVGQIKNRDML